MLTIPINSFSPTAEQYPRFIHQSSLPVKLNQSVIKLDRINLWQVYGRKRGHSGNQHTDQQTCSMEQIRQYPRFRTLDARSGRILILRLDRHSCNSLRRFTLGGFL